MDKVTTLVLPMAGLGKRLLPLTKKTPKNLLKVNGKPLIEYVLEEAVASGIKKAILIVNPKHVKDFKRYVAARARRFPSLSFIVRVQPTPGGNGHAIAQAYDLIKDKPFAVRFCDDVLLAEAAAGPKAVTGALDPLLRLFERAAGKEKSVVLLERVPKDMVSRFGVVGVEKGKGKKMFANGAVYKVTKIVEKPPVKEAPSNLTIVGGYVFGPDVVRNLKMVADTLPVVADDALPVAVAIQMQLAMKGNVYGWEFPGKRLDCGTLEKLMQAEEYLKAASVMKKRK
jgi:UTP--glucose-1-phosphate uridylyltransferase